ncbi:MAG: hypothetical protein LBE31_03625 [Deltaproteobacteria bacterium]|jgi:flavodoxin|nr:hypothetical protein [Deltaproteobacteria bacterium]
MTSIVKTILAIVLALSLMWTGFASADEPASSSDRSLIIVFSLTNKTMSIAEILAKKTGAEIYTIAPAEPFPADELATIEAEEARRKAGTPLELASPPPNLDGYNLVYLGSPTWFGEPPEIVQLFLSKADFKAAKVALFVTSGTRPANVVDTLTALVGPDKLAGPAFLQRRADDWTPVALEKKIDDWLAAVNSAVKPK